MRKLIYPALLALALIVLVGCGGGQPTEQFTATQEGVISEDPVESDDVSDVAPDEEVAVQIETPPNYCLDCHINQARLIETTSPEEELQESEGPGWVGEVIYLEPWEKVLIDGENFLETIHGQIDCIDCHGGVQEADKEIAHTGVIRNPSADPQTTCGQCHANIVANQQNSLHSNLNGFWRSLEIRSNPSNHPALAEMFGNHCASCHTTCGDCHISQPATVGGGFINGHLFDRTPSMTRNCIACHGNQVGDEYLGTHEGLMADVHFRQGEMTCVSCHSAAQMHGEPANCSSCHAGPESEQVPPPDHRYGGIQTPSCEACHASVSTGRDGIIMHEMHGATLSCQVCHSVAYINCEGCHVSISEAMGNPYYVVQNSYLEFLIGRNPIQSFQRPYSFVPVRHVPIARDSYAFYGNDLLPNFDQLETWKYATPHNIQRNTPQNASCNACHGNAELFLTADKVDADELQANRRMIVDTVPPAITSAEQLP
jgi:hypothetical protein